MRRFSQSLIVIAALSFGPSFAAAQSQAADRPALAVAQQDVQIAEGLEMVQSMLPLMSWVLLQEKVDQTEGLTLADFDQDKFNAELGDIFLPRFEQAAHEGLAGAIEARFSAAEIADMLNDPASAAAQRYQNERDALFAEVKSLDQDAMMAEMDKAVETLVDRYVADAQTR